MQNRNPLSRASVAPRRSREAPLVPFLPTGRLDYDNNNTALARERLRKIRKEKKNAAAYCCC